MQRRFTNGLMLVADAVDRGVQQVDTLVNALPRDDQRTSEAHRAPATSENDEAILEAAFQDRIAEGAVRKIERAHEAATTDLRDSGMLLLESSEPIQ